MPKFSINDYKQYDLIGFDLDGTLYDEFEFIHQIYRKMAAYISSIVHEDIELVFRHMCNLWLEYGSSRVDLFQSFFNSFEVDPETEHIEKCLCIYRESDFELQLPARSRAVLDSFNAEGIPFFLVTDGFSSLQNKKFNALNLRQWFEFGSVYYTGDFGKNYQKPNTLIIKEMDSLLAQRRKILYFGDRDIDREFAKNAGFDFQLMKCMNPLRNIEI